MATLGNYKVEFSTDGTTWVDVSGEANSFDPGETSRESAEWYALNADAPEVVSGPRHANEFTISVKYADSQTAAAQQLWDWFVGNTALQFRATPIDGQGYRWTSAEVYLTSCTPPKKEGGSADPLLMEVKGKGVLTKEAVA